MSHFYGNMKGSRGEVTRCGTKISGVMAHVRGWDVGVKAYVYQDEDTGEDKVQLFLTSGSNDRLGSYCLGTYSHADLKRKMDASLL